MEKEERRSRFAAEYQKALDNSARSKRIAARKAETLRKKRKEEAVKRERRKKAEEAVKKIEEEFLILSGVEQGGYVIIDDPKDPDGIFGLIASCQRILGDLLSCRNAQIESMKRQQLVESKYQVFKSQLGAVDNDVRMLRRAIRLIEINPGIVGAESLNNNIDELNELRKKLSIKEETYLELSAISKSREAQLSAANRSVQSLKITTNECNDLMHQRIKQMHDLEEKLTRRSNDCRKDKDRYIEEKEKLKMKEIGISRRIKTLEKEMKRIKHHKGKTVDTDAWVEGVMQRSITKELKAHLKGEYQQECQKLNEMKSQIHELIEKTFLAEDNIYASKRAADKISIACRAFAKEHRKFSTLSASSLLNDLSNQQNNATRNQNRKEKEAKLLALQNDSNEQNETNSITVSKIEEVRRKDFEVRTKDERRFVGIDLVLNPEAYLHVSMVEAEQMRFDEDYQCELSKADIQRIQSLPQKINLALPFLHTHEEIEAHRLLNSFVRDYDDKYFKTMDFLYEETPTEVQDALSKRVLEDDSGSKINIVSGDMREAEIVHDILVKESRRDRIRSLGAGDELSEDEENWCQIDKIINPELYFYIDNSVVDVHDRTIERDLSTNSAILQKNKRVVDLENEQELHKRSRSDPLAFKDSASDGNKYQELRWFHDESSEKEAAFNDKWNCPFTKDEILSIRKQKLSDIIGEDALKVRQLLDKFYVSNDESVLGNLRLKSLLDASSTIVSFLKTSDQEAQIESNMRLDERSKLRAPNANHHLDGNRSTEDALKTKSSTSIDSDSSLFQPVDHISSATTMNEKHDDDDTLDINRLWGGWDTVHPASGGMESQSAYFMRSSFDPSRDHPANFGIHDDLWNEKNSNDTSYERKALPEGSELEKVSMTALTSDPGRIPNRFDIHENDPSSDYLIADSANELALMEVRRIKGKIVLLAVPDPLTIFEVNNLQLDSRQSRSHKFEIPNRDDQRILEVNVSIIFQGRFGDKGYKLGRLAAGLFRIPDEHDNHANPIPVPIGYSPYNMQSCNLPESMGRIVIIHSPKRKPIKPGHFQIVIGVASDTNYSVHVSCKIARAALPVVDEAIIQAKELQARLPNILIELDSLSESHRLAERKLLVCQKMINDAEAETNRCKRSMSIVSHKLEIDDEEMTLLEDERRELERELAILEVEYSQWANIFASRHQEEIDIKEGIKLIFEFQRERQEEKKRIKGKLTKARHDLPACIASLRSIVEATNVAANLNTTVQGASASWGASMSGAFSTGPKLITPAEEVRKRMKREGFKHLVMEEQQWSLLDRSMNPHKYEWLKEQEEDEKQARLAMGKLPEEIKLPAVLEPFRLTKGAIIHVMKTPFSMLSRKEVIIRKLMVKYHDDPLILKRSTAAIAYGFDPHLAERTRAKMVSTYSKEEKEWSSIDRILHPEVWRYYVNQEKVTGMDRDAKKSKVDHTSTSHGIANNRDENNNNKIKSFNGNDSQIERNNDINLTKIETNKKQDTVTAMGKILGMQQEFENQTSSDSINLDQMLEGAQKQLSKKQAVVDMFNCTFSKEKILQIWRTPKHKLSTDDERNCFRLLQKYNGSYDAYIEVQTESEKRKLLSTQAGKHIIWDAAGRTPEVDIDTRARVVLAEIDRVAHSENDFMHSDVLHTSDQMFPTPVLRVQLEEELDRILGEQILDRERAMKLRIDSDSDSDEDEDDEDEDDDIIPVVDPALEGEEREQAEKEILKKVQKRHKKREKRKTKLKEQDIDEEIVKVKKKIDTKGKTGKELEEIHLLTQLGYGGCLACRSNPCQWDPCVDVDIVNERKKLLDQEAERVRLDKDSETIESDICMSAQLGGNRIFKRLDLLDELAQEIVELERRLHLNDVDKELHDAYASRKEYCEVKSLHGYSMMLWTNNARVALEARQSRLVAYTVAKEAVDDILDWMLEGWYFGERESSFAALGRVPSLAEDGKFIRAGQNQIATVEATVEKMKKRKESSKNGTNIAAKRGTISEKSISIEMDKDERLKGIKVARDGNRHEHMLNETEQTLRFGLFMLTLMYFRAMTFVSREKKSWAGNDEEVGPKKPKVMTDERMQMIEEENKAEARRKKVELVLARCKVGEARRLEREAAERREAVLELQRVVRRQKLEFNSVTHIQRVFRGHLGRKAAKRWALKRAELGAMNALLNATAICIQRCYRGYLARVLTVRKRAEMAQFIALMRAQEAQADEEVFWETHPWQRFKRDQKEWTDKKLRSAHKTEVLGGARLSEEEEEALKEAALNSIDEDLEDDDDDDDDDDNEEGKDEEEIGVNNNDNNNDDDNGDDDI